MKKEEKENEKKMSMFDGASIVGKYGYARDGAIECVWCLDDRTKEEVVGEGTKDAGDTFVGRGHGDSRMDAYCNDITQGRSNKCNADVCESDKRVRCC